MVDKRMIEQVLSEQRLEIEALRDADLCARKEEALVDLDSNMAQVVIGVRRSGKSKCIEVAQRWFCLCQF